MIEESHPETERRQADLLREMGGRRRLALMASLSDTVIQLSKRAIRRANPGLSEDELKLEFISLLYGREMVERLRKLAHK